MITLFIQCKNCGKYIPREQAVSNLYCSEDCITRYNSCIICGKYFMMSHGFKENICSQQCSVAYKITKLYESEEKPIPEY